ncbi:hypothetical protein [Chitinophaga rhizophila]|uniref:Uncharacterized protein n=1 Tax=Chitinophaga rhizophila TaxID=2866212 RepID=A0ABS7GB88_9BACT|nr:hypothetical protein [Chitinophaga rhizophila]MBW8684681.1 hypothetical protein [Chitinophaga rhizophila]
MAIVKYNPFIDGLSGTVGKKINFRVRKGKTIVAVKRGPNTTPPTEEQQEVREQFIKASLFAQNAIKDPVTKALYQKAAKGGQTAYNAAFRDAVKPPVIDNIDTDAYKGAVGDKILIRARDVITPQSVTVAIVSEAGVVLEQGDAVLNINDRRTWIYTATAANAAVPRTTVIVSATDLPGNTAEKEVTIP